MRKWPACDREYYAITNDITKEVKIFKSYFDMSRWFISLPIDDAMYWTDIKRIKRGGITDGCNMVRVYRNRVHKIRRTNR